MKSFKQFITEALDINNNPNFWKWFGQSKVVDKHGNPLVVYHGSSYNIDYFSTNSRRVAYFTVCPDEASEYAHTSAYTNRDNAEDDEEADGYRETVYAVFLKIENPFNPDNPEHRTAIGMDDECDGTWDWMEGYVDDIKSAGFDGMLVREVDDATIFDYAVFNPTQVKSATGNNGNFDPRTSDINK